MEHKIKIYISSKMTGEKNNNFDAFDAKEAEIKQKYNNSGIAAEIINPANISRKLEKTGRELSWADYMRADITALMDCQIIYMFGDWRNSRGAQLEYKIAVELGHVIIYDEGGENGKQN